MSNYDEDVRCESGGSLSPPEAAYGAPDGRQPEVRDASPHGLLSRRFTSAGDGGGMAETFVPRNPLLGSWELDGELITLRASDGFSRIFGWAPPQNAVPFAAFLAAIPDAGRKCLRQTIEICLGTREPFDIEHRIVRGDGSGWTFTYNSALNSYTLTSPPDERAQLVQNPAAGTFTITFADGTQKVFNTNNQLAAIIDRNGNATTLAYDSYGRLATVTSAGGTTLTFNYGNANNPSLVTSAADAVGTVDTYAYNSSSDLTQVTYPDGSQYNFTFDANSNIAAVTDSHSKLIESHTYDAQNRGLTSARAYGVDSVSLTY